MNFDDEFVQESGMRTVIRANVGRWLCDLLRPAQLLPEELPVVNDSAFLQRPVSIRVTTSVYSGIGMLELETPNTTVRLMVSDVTHHDFRCVNVLKLRRTINNQLNDDDQLHVIANDVGMRVNLPGIGDLRPLDQLDDSIRPLVKRVALRELPQGQGIPLLWTIPSESAFTKVRTWINRNKDRDIAFTVQEQGDGYVTAFSSWTNDSPIECIDPVSHFGLTVDEVDLRIMRRWGTVDGRYLSETMFRRKNTRMGVMPGLAQRQDAPSYPDRMGVTIDGRIFFGFGDASLIYNNVNARLGRHMVVHPDQLPEVDVKTRKRRRRSTPAQPAVETVAPTPVVVEVREVESEPHPAREERLQAWLEAHTTYCNSRGIELSDSPTVWYSHYVMQLIATGNQPTPLDLEVAESL